MRSAVWITFLVALFTFQSIWNVAAAFCVHESVSSTHNENQTNQVSTKHFGHHDTSLHPTHASNQSVNEDRDRPNIQAIERGQSTTDSNRLTANHTDSLNSYESPKELSAQQQLPDVYLDDHTDHLPSMGHVILSKVKQLDLVVWQARQESEAYTWANAYQSPDLFHHSPPPELSPLMVG